MARSSIAPRSSGRSPRAPAYRKSRRTTSSSACSAISPSSTRAPPIARPPARRGLGATRISGRAGRRVGSASPPRSRGSIHPEPDRRIALHLIHERDFPLEVLAGVLEVIGAVVVRLVPDVVARGGGALYS